MHKAANDPQQIEPDSPLKTFIDCLAGILARQWLHDQQRDDRQLESTLNDFSDRSTAFGVESSS